jgi:hypothetical protein
VGADVDARLEKACAKENRSDETVAGVFNLLSDADTGPAEGGVGRVVQVAAVHRVLGSHGTNGDDSALALAAEMWEHKTVNVYGAEDVE